MQQLAGANKKRKRTGSVDAFPIVNGIIMLVIVVITLYPVLAISLNDGTDALRGGIYLWPRKFTWKNYITVLQKDNLITGAYVTVARTVIGTVLALAANAILAFVVSRKRFLFYILMILSLLCIMALQFFGQNERDGNTTEKNLIYQGTFTWQKSDGSSEKISVPGQYDVKAKDTMTILTRLPEDYHENTLAIRSSLQSV